MQYWILQSNPSKFRLLDWLRDFNWLSDPKLVDCWSINYYNKEVVTGDLTFIWKSKGNEIIRGIYAIASVVPIPTRFPLENIEPQYFIDKEEMKRLDNLPQIAIRYTRIFLDNPILEDEIKKQPEMNRLTIFRNARTGIHKVDSHIGNIIENLSANR